MGSANPSATDRGRAATTAGRSATATSRSSTALRVKSRTSGVSNLGSAATHEPTLPLESDLRVQLQPLISALSGAATMEQVAEAITSHSIPLLGAETCSVCILSDDGDDLIILKLAGFPQELSDVVRRLSAHASFPVTDAIRQR